MSLGQRRTSTLVVPLATVLLAAMCLDACWAATKPLLRPISVLNDCKRIDWYKLPPEIPPGTVERSQIAKDGAGYEDKTASVAKLSRVTLKEGDKNFAPMLELIKRYFGGWVRINLWTKARPWLQSLPKGVSTEEGALFLYTSTNVDNKDWTCLPQLPEDVLSRRAYCEDLLTAIPLSSIDSFDNNREEQAFRLRQLDALFCDSPSPDPMLDPAYRKRVSQYKEDNQNYGFIDKTGKIVFNAGDAYDLDAMFSEGLLKVQEPWGTTFWDVAGKAAFPEAFDGASRFRGGLCAVFKNDKWGYIDRSGKMVVKPTFDKASDFCQGLAAVFVQGRWGYTDRNGTLLVEPQFDNCTGFSEGLAAVCKDSKIGFIDKKGNFVIAPQYEFAGSFVDGIAVVAALEGPDKIHRIQYIDRAGKVVLDRTALLERIDKSYKPDAGWCFTDSPAEISAADLVEARYLAALVGNRLGDSRFEMLEANYGLEAVSHVSALSKQLDVYSPSNSHQVRTVHLLDLGYEDQAGPVEFSEGLISLRIGDTQYAIVRPDGSVAFTIDAIDVYQFHDGLARVVVSDPSEIIGIKYGYIDRDGRYVVAPNLYVAEDFSDGVAVVRRDRSTDYEIIDKTGKSIGCTSLYRPGPFSEGLARAGFGSASLPDLLRFGPGPETAKPAGAPTLNLAPLN